MIAGRLLGFGLVGTVTLLAACQPTPTPVASNGSQSGNLSTSAGAPGSGAATGTQAVPTGDTQEALVAKQTAAYAAQMQTLLEQRKANAAHAGSPRTTQDNNPSGAAAGNPAASGSQPKRSPTSESTANNPAATGAQPIPSEVSWSTPGQGQSDPAFTGPRNDSGHQRSQIPNTPPGSAPSSPISSMGPANPHSSPTTGELANVPTRIAPAAIPASATIDPTPDNALMSKLVREVRQDPSNPSAQLNLQLYKYLSDDQSPDVASLQSLSPEDREIVLAVMDSLGNFRNGIHADRRMLTNQKIKPLMELGDRLRSQADLSIPTLALCREVRGFGNYDEMSPRFIAGKTSQTVVYCEVANFSSQLAENQSSDKQMWQTSLTQEIALYTESGMAVMLDKSPKQSTDLCRERRHDFYIPRLLTLPPNLSIGRYYLKVSVVDKQANRVAESSIPIDIVAE